MRTDTLHEAREYQRRTPAAAAPQVPSDTGPLRRSLTTISALPDPTAPCLAAAERVGQPTKKSRTQLDYVDITLFFKQERAVVAIENKIDETAPEHAEQVRGYEKTLRETYRGKYDVIRSVLLTTSDQRQLFLPVAAAAIGPSRRHPRGV